MDKIFSESAYDEMIQRLFCRFPSFQKVGAGAYKPGTANMEFADQLMGHPHRKYRIVSPARTARDRCPICLHQSCRLQV